MIPQMEIAVFIRRLWREATVWSRDLLVRSRSEIPSKKLLKRGFHRPRLVTG